MNHCPASSKSIQPNVAFTKAARPVSRKVVREVAESFCFRVTPSEKARLKEMAGRRYMSDYIRHKLFGETIKPRRTLRRPSMDNQAHARLLGALGQSRLASNMNQIAKAANMGALPVTDDLLIELTQACADIASMRQDLIAALGITARD